MLLYRSLFLSFSAGIKDNMKKQPAKIDFNLIICGILCSTWNIIFQNTQVIPIYPQEKLQRFWMPEL